MYNSDLNKADAAVEETIDILSELAEKHNESKELFDELILAKEKLENVNALLDSADDEISDLETQVKELPDEDDILEGYDTIETGFGTVYIKCDNENDRQLFNALLDCLKQPNVNRNELHEYLHQRAGLMAGFHS
jgi:uncharacterized phage infection (PIP) family protein YhgE